jgi:2-alkyl-3-oxoalkanoate reductase
MRIFVAGASGALGVPLVTRLVADGHEVVAMTRTPGKQERLRALGAQPVVADALDSGAVADAVAKAEPEVIVHQLTALSGKMDMRNLDRFFATTNRLRTEGTDNLLAAGRAAGVRRVIAQSFGAYALSRTGGPALSETDPVDDDDPPKRVRSTLAAIRHLERAVTGIDWAEGIALRYGFFYGPGTGLSRDPDADMSRAIRKRQFPIVGSGDGVFSFIHVDDAAAATALALERGAPGIYQVTDDEPAPIREWLPVLATALGAKPPLRVPLWLGRLMAGEVAVAMMTKVKGASNAKAKRELGWRPRWSSWRQGFTKGLE